MGNLYRLLSDYEKSAEYLNKSLNILQSDTSYDVILFLNLII